MSADFHPFTLSLSDLVKKSAKKIVWERKQKEANPNYTPPKSGRMIDGEKHQQKITVSEFQEMRYSYTAATGLTINMCFDEIKIKDWKTVKFIEHKSFYPDVASMISRHMPQTRDTLRQAFKEPAPLWLILSSRLQMYAYASFLTNGWDPAIPESTTLWTAHFHQMAGHPLKKLVVDEHPKHNWFRIHYKSNYPFEYQESFKNLDLADEIVCFFVEKALATVDYQTAGDFDLKYPFKETINIWDIPINPELTNVR